MERDKLEIKDEYTGEEVLELVKEALFQISMDMDDNYYELKEKIDKENDSLLKAGMLRKKHQLKDDRRLIDTYYSETRSKWHTECCDAPIKSLPLGDGRCSECRNKEYESYEVEPTIQDFIKFLNNKIDEENQK